MRIFHFEAPSCEGEMLKGSALICKDNLVLLMPKTEFKQILLDTQELALKLFEYMAVGEEQLTYPLG